MNTVPTINIGLNSSCLVTLQCTTLDPYLVCIGGECVCKEGTVFDGEGCKECFMSTIISITFTVFVMWVSFLILCGVLYIMFGQTIKDMYQRRNTSNQDSSSRCRYLCPLSCLPPPKYEDVEPDPPTYSEAMGVEEEAKDPKKIIEVEEEPRVLKKTEVFVVHM